MQAQQLHKCVVEDDGHQGHQDVGEAHVEDDGGPCGEAGDGGWQGSSSPGSGAEVSPGLGWLGSAASCWRPTWVFVVQVVHIGDKAVVGQKKSHSSQQHGKVNPVVSILGLGILRNCPKRGKKEKRCDSSTGWTHGTCSRPQPWGNILYGK